MCSYYKKNILFLILHYKVLGTLSIPTLKDIQHFFFVLQVYILTLLLELVPREFCLHFFRHVAISSATLLILTSSLITTVYPINKCCPHCLVGSVYRQKMEVRVQYGLLNHEEGKTY